MKEIKEQPSESAALLPSRVDDSKDEPSRPNDLQSASRKNTITTSTSDTVYIGNLPLKYATEAVIEKLLQPHGRVQRVSVQRRHTTTSQKSQQHAFAFGQLQSPAQATTAIRALDGRKLGGQRLRVRPAHENSKPTTTLSGSTTAMAKRPASLHQQKRQLESRIQAIQQQLRRHNRQGELGTGINAGKDR